MNIFFTVFLLICGSVQIRCFEVGHFVDFKEFLREFDECTVYEATTADFAHFVPFNQIQNGLTKTSDSLTFEFYVIAARNIHVLFSTKEANSNREGFEFVIGYRDRVSYRRRGMGDYLEYIKPRPNFLSRNKSTKIILELTSDGWMRLIVNGVLNATDSHKLTDHIDIQTLNYVGLSSYENECILFFFNCRRDTSHSCNCPALELPNSNYYRN